MKTFTYLFSIILGAALLPGVASAERGRGQGGSPDGPPQGFVDRLDRDGDGRVSADEFDGPAEHFSHFDRNGDQYISEDEAPKGPPRRQQGERFGQNDRMNGSGRGQRGGQQGFGQGNSQGQDHAYGRNGQDSGQGGQDHRQAFLDRFDQDQDGRVAQDEFDGPAPHFNQLDADHNGYIEESELPTEPPPRR